VPVEQASLLLGHSWPTAAQMRHGWPATQNGAASARHRHPIAGAA
jgi:hypothetical protein